MSLAAFAEEKKKKKSCAVCGLPPEALTEANTGHKNGIKSATISEWLLATYDIEVGRQTFDNHFANKHATRHTYDPQ